MLDGRRQVDFGDRDAALTGNGVQKKRAPAGIVLKNSWITQLVDLTIRRTPN